jgi:hypothetical protein
MYFQDNNLFIHALVKLKFMMVNKLTLLLNDASPLLGSIAKQRREDFSPTALELLPCSMDKSWEQA